VSASTVAGGADDEQTTLTLRRRALSLLVELSGVKGNVVTDDVQLR
jgi:hypothetical protein